MKTDKNKQLQKTGKKETSIVRSSAAEYLTFVAATDREILQDAGRENPYRLKNKDYILLKFEFFDKINE